MKFHIHIGEDEVTVRYPGRPWLDALYEADLHRRGVGSAIRNTLIALALLLFGLLLGQVIDLTLEDVFRGASMGLLARVAWLMVERKRVYDRYLAVSRECIARGTKDPEFRVGKGSGEEDEDT